MIRRLLILTAALAWAVAVPVSPRAEAGLVATYQFQNTLAADQAGMPALVALNSGSFVTATDVLGQTRTVYERMSTSNLPADQSALTVSAAALGLSPTDYSVELVYDFTNSLDPRGPNTDFRRVVNANGADNGLYVGTRSGPGSLMVDDYSGGSHTGGPTLVDGVYHHLVLSVNPTGEQVYINGVLAVDLAGATPNAITASDLAFFLDNSFEYGNGHVALLRIYDSALDARQVSAAWNNGNPFAFGAVPEPASLAMAGLGGLAVLGLASARRKSRAA